MGTFFGLQGKTGIVTGAASGIGKATAQRLASAGAKVVCADIADASAVAESAGGLARRCDIGSEAEVAALAAAASEFGGGSIEFLVNCAGIPEVGGPVTDAPDASYRKALEINFLGAVRMLRAVAPSMPPGASIVNIASLAAEVSFPTYATYGASKAALVNFTLTSAIELGTMGIRVNCIEPSAVDTPMMDSPDAEAEAMVMNAITPLGRICQPEEVAALVHFLVADDCQFVTGQAIRICGGLTAGISVGLIEGLAAAAA